MKEPEGIFSEIKLVGPNEAAEILKHNERNRPITQKRVIELALVMKKGDFRYTDESIKIDANNRLLDGQHRLNAIIKSGCKVYLRVTRGLNTNAFEVLDRGKRRSPAEVLAMAGVQNYAGCAATATWLDRLTNHQGKKARFSPSSIEVREWLEAFPLIPEMVKQVRKRKVTRVLSSTGLAAAVGIMASSEQERTDVVHPKILEFFDQVGLGLGLTTTSPAFVLRQKLDSERAAKHLKIEEKAIGLIKTWNKFLIGAEVKSLVLGLRTDRREVFPTPNPVPSCDFDEEVSGG